MTARLIAGLAVAAGMCFVGTAQAQFFTDFDTDGSVDAGTDAVNTNLAISALEMTGGDFFEGAGGNWGDGFTNRPPQGATMVVTGGVATMNIDTTNVVLQPTDTGPEAFSFWYGGMNAVTTVPAGTTLADLDLSAVVRGSGADGNGTIDLIVRNNAFDKTVDTSYTLKFDPDSAAPGAFTTIGGNVLANFTSNDTDPFNPKNPLDLSSPLKIQIEYGNGKNGWGLDANNIIDVDSINFVPEPASLSLLALGGLAMLRRRA